MIIIGLMSGTSADGIDVALCEITGAPPRLQARVIAGHTYPYDDAMRRRILTACDPHISHVDALCQLSFDLAEAFAEACVDLVQRAGITFAQVDLIASHGQTVWHQVTAGRVTSTLQIVEPAVIAERTGVTTIANFRPRDVAAGGQGAPLTAYVDWLLLRRDTGWRAVQNIGGMGNVTFLPPLTSDASSIAFDTGPGNALIDATVLALTNGAQSYDEGGQLAQAGHIDNGWLEELLAHPYFEQAPPKTTGRELFGSAYTAELISAGQARGLTPPDIVATLTALTAFSITDAYERFAPEHLTDVIIGGGGRHNPVLMNHLQQQMPSVHITSHEALDMDSDFKEALVFAVLAYETWHHRPGTLPAQTGASHATVIGQIIPAANFSTLIKETWGL